MVRRAEDDVGPVSYRAAFGSAGSTRSSDSVALNPAVRPLGAEAAITTAPVRLPGAVAREAVLVRLAPTAAAAELRPALTRSFLGFAFGVARIIDARGLRRWAF
jgi:hypothetical protein